MPDFRSSGIFSGLSTFAVIAIAAGAWLLHQPALSVKAQQLAVQTRAINSLRKEVAAAQDSDSQETEVPTQAASDAPAEVPTRPVHTDRPTSASAEEQNIYDPNKPQIQVSILVQLKKSQIRDFEPLIERIQASCAYPVKFTTVGQRSMTVVSTYQTARRIGRVLSLLDKQGPDAIKASLTAWNRLGLLIAEDKHGRLESELKVALGSSGQFRPTTDVRLTAVDGKEVNSLEDLNRRLLPEPFGLGNPTLSFVLRTGDTEEEMKSRWLLRNNDRWATNLTTVKYPDGTIKRYRRRENQQQMNRADVADDVAVSDGVFVRDEVATLLRAQQEAENSNSQSRRTAEKIRERYRLLVDQIAGQVNEVTPEDDNSNLRTLIRESFRLRQDLQRLEIDRLRDKIAALEQRLEQRERMVNEIVEERLRELRGQNYGRERSAQPKPDSRTAPNSNFDSTSAFDRPNVQTERTNPLSALLRSPNQTVKASEQTESADPFVDVTNMTGLNRNSAPTNPNASLILAKPHEIRAEIQAGISEYNRRKTRRSLGRYNLAITQFEVQMQLLESARDLAKDRFSRAEKRYKLGDGRADEVSSARARLEQLLLLEKLYRQAGDHEEIKHGDKPVITAIQTQGFGTMTFFVNRGKDDGLRTGQTVGLFLDGKKLVSAVVSRCEDDVATVTPTGERRTVSGIIRRAMEKEGGLDAFREKLEFRLKEEAEGDTDRNTPVDVLAPEETVPDEEEAAEAAPDEPEEAEEETTSEDELLGESPDAETAEEETTASENQSVR